MSPKVQGGSAQTEDGALMRNIEFLMEQAILGQELNLAIFVKNSEVQVESSRYKLIQVDSSRVK